MFFFASYYNIVSIQDYSSSSHYTTLITLTVPPGSYLVSAKATVSADTGVGTIDCQLATSNNDVPDRSGALLDANPAYPGRGQGDQTTIPMLGTVSFTQSGTIWFQCASNNLYLNSGTVGQPNTPGAKAYNMQLAAIQTGQINPLPSPAAGI